MPAALIDRFRFLDGFMNQSPRLLSSIRGKDYRFFPELERESDDMRGRWTARREALRMAMSGDSPDPSMLAELRKFEAEVAPLGRMLDRLRRLIGGLSAGTLKLAPSEKAVWYEESAVVARGQRIPVSVYITTERFHLVRGSAGPSGRLARDYRLAELKGVSPLPEGEGSVLLFGAEKIAMGTGSPDYWRKLIAKIRSHEFQSQLFGDGASSVAEDFVVKESPMASAPAEPEPQEEPPLGLHEQAEDVEARTTILDAAFVARAASGGRAQLSLEAAEEEPSITLASPHDVTQKMERPQEVAAAVEEKAHEPDEFELLEEPEDEPAISSDAFVDVREAAVAATTGSMKARADLHSVLESPEPSQEDEGLAVEAEETAPHGEEARPAMEKGPGGHEVLPFDSIFESAGTQADDAVPPPESRKAEAAISTSPSSPPAARPPAQSPERPPTQRSPDKPSPPDRPAPLSPALRGLASKDALRSQSRGDTRYHAKTGESLTPAAAVSRPSATAKDVPAPRGALLLVGAVALVIVMIAFVVIVMRLRSPATRSPIELPSLEQRSLSEQTPPASPPAAPSPPPPSATPPVPEGTPEATVTPAPHEMEETYVVTPAGPKPLVAEAPPESAAPVPPPSTSDPALHRIPPYDPAIKEYRITLTNGRDWTVPRYRRLRDRIQVPVKGGSVELPFADISRIDPIKP